MERINFFLFSFLAHERINLITPDVKRSKEKSMKSIESLFIECQFLKKIHLDPGFRLYIYNKISTPSMHRYIFRNFLQFLSSYVIIKDKFQKFNNPNEFSFYISNISDRDPQHFSSRLLIASSRLSTNILKDEVIKYLFPTWVDLMKAGEHKKAAALESIFLEMKTGFFAGYNQYLVEDIPRKTLQYGIYYKVLHKFFKRIDFFMYDYLQSNTQSLQYFQNSFKLISFTMQPRLKILIDEILSHVCDVLNIKKEIINEEEINEILEIISLMYLNQLPIQEKYSVLNRFFGMKFVLAYMKDNFEKNQVWNFVRSNLLILTRYGVLDLFTDYFSPQYFKISEIEDEILTKFLITQFVFPNKTELFFLDNNPLLSETSKNLKVKITTKKLILCSLFKWMIITAFGDSLKNSTENMEKIQKILSFVSTKYGNRKKIQKRVVLTYLILYRIYNHVEKEKIVINRLFSEENQKNIVKKDNFYKIFEFHLGINRIRGFHNNNSLEFLITCVLNENYSQIEDYLELRMKELNQNGVSNDFQREIFQVIMKNVAYGNTLQCYGKTIAKLNVYKPEIHTFNEKEQFSFYENLIFAHFYLRDMDIVLDLINEYNKHNNAHIYFERYRFAINIALNNHVNLFSELLEYFVRGKLPNPNTNEEYHTFFDDMIFDIYLWKKDNQFYQFIQQLTQSDHFKKLKNNEIADFYFTLGNSLADRGLTKKALKFYESCEQYCDDEKILAESYGGRGTACLEMEMVQEAKNWLKKAIKHYPKATYFFNYSRCFSIYRNYCTAIEILEKGIENPQITSDYSQLIMLEEELDICKSKCSMILNLDSIEVISALEHLKSASRFISIADKLFQVSNNSSFIFTEIANGVDCIVQANFNPVINRYISDHCPNPILEKNLWNYLPNVVKNIKKNRNAGLGDWKWLFRNIRKNAQNLLFKKIRSYFPNNFTDAIMQKLEEQFTILTDTRNPAAHGEVINRDEYLQLIRPYIRAGNICIHLFAKI